MEYSEGEYILYELEGSKYIGLIISMYSSDKGILINVNPEISLGKGFFDTSVINIIDTMVICKLDKIISIDEQAKMYYPQLFI